MNNLKDRKILLIGGAGFIGHNLALRLKGLGAEVAIIDSLAVNNLYFIQNNINSIPNAGLYLSIIEERLDLLRSSKIPIHEMDARNYHELCAVLRQIDPDTIIHLAAVAHADRSNKDPYSTFDHSFRTLENALDAARAHQNRIRHFIYFSSSMV